MMMPTRSTTRAKTSSGFTLLELMTIVTMVGILGSLALVNLSAQWQRQKLKSSSQAMVDWLQERRRQAMALQNASSMGRGVCLITINPSTATLSAPLSGQVQGSTGSLINVNSLCHTPKTLNLKAIVPNNTGIQLSILNSSSPSDQSLLFTFRGTSTTQREFKIVSPSVPGAYCIKVMAPLGLIKSGKAATSSANCNYQDGSLNL